MDLAHQSKYFLHWLIRQHCSKVKQTLGQVAPYSNHHQDINREDNEQGHIQNMGNVSFQGDF